MPTRKTIEEESEKAAEAERCGVRKRVFPFWGRAGAHGISYREALYSGAFIHNAPYSKLCCTLRVAGDGSM